MNDLCADIGYKSINHYGEELCGDHVDIVEPNDESTVIVLSDGLGSGVKASILSTLTSKIISTMLSEGLSLEECVETIAATLPVCSVRGVAYSTFTIIHLKQNQTAEIIQYDNPHAIIIRNEQNWDYPKTEMNIGGKKIFKSVIKLQENDIFIAMSDGCPHAGIGTAYNFGWKREDIITFMEALAHVGYTAKTLSTMLVDECDNLYGHEPGDDATACVVKQYEHRGFKNDGASLICRLLFEEATDINFYVGRAINPAHQNPDLPINFSIKMNLVEELSKCLKQMGKKIKVSYF